MAKKLPRKRPSFDCQPEPGGCPRCSGLVDVEVGADEDQDAEVLMVAACGCGWERSPVPQTPAQLRQWTRQRLAIVRERAR